MYNSDYEQYIAADPYRYGMPDRHDEPDFLPTNDDEEEEEIDHLKAISEWKATWSGEGDYQRNREKKGKQNVK